MGPILVLGKTGQLARCLVDVAAQRALPIIAVGRRECDLEDPGSINRAVNAALPRAIVNAAGYSAVDRAESEPERAFVVNRDGARRLAATARRLQIPFVHVSTDYVFDGRKSSAYFEDDIPRPLGVYGRSKLEGESAVMDTNPDALVFRTSWVYSLYGTNFLKTVLRLADTRDVVRVVDDQRGAPTAAIDVASAIVDALGQVNEKNAQARAGIYHVTAAGETTWYGFARVILSAIASADYPSLVVRPANSRLDCGKIDRVFGIRMPLWSMSVGACLDVLCLGRTCGHAKGNYSGRRERNAALSNNARYQQAANADFRQADDLLSAVDVCLPEFATSLLSRRRMIALSLSDCLVTGANGASDFATRHSQSQKD